MAEKPAPSLRTLQHSAAQLNFLTDQLTAGVKELEATLNSFSFGSYSSVPLGKPANQYLYFGPSAGQRALRIGVSSSYADGTVDDKPWDQCSREVKLRAAKALPILIERIEASISEQIQDAALALNCLERFLSAKEGGVVHGHK
jgi:hypothetical protein